MLPRRRISLDGLWSFCPSAQLDLVQESLIAVPSPWQADARFREHTGTAWYQRQFDLPASWLMPGRVTILGFGAVDYFAEVWVNGFWMGRHEGGYLPFEFDVSAAIHEGTNTIRVRVEDPPEIFAEIPHGKQSWYGMLSGIWQSVWLENRPAQHIQHVKIRTVDEEVRVDVRLSSALQGVLEAEIFAPDGRSVAQAQAQTEHFSMRVESPQCWSPEMPNLYTLQVCCGDDVLCETFGFRHIEARNGQILLNGQPFYLRAALDQDYYPELICTPPSQEYIEAQFRQAKALGLNSLRIHIKVADPRYYAAADKIGLLIWTELPNHILLSERSSQRARQTLAGIVERDGNHPSIAIWTIINEAWGVDVSNPEHRAWMAEMYDFVKELDPTRLVSGNSACWGNFNVVSDLDEYHMYFAMPDHHIQWRDWVAEFAKRPWWSYACDYDNAAAWREYQRAPWLAAPRLPAPEVRRRGDEPLLVSEFGNWGLPNVDALLAGYGGEPWWFETGLDWGDGVVYPHGVQARFRQYGLDRVFASLQELAAVSQELQFAAMKYEIEQIRRHNSIQGYVITELTDVHWECNGLLDMLRAPKIYFERFAAVNADDMLIPVWERLAIGCGETCTMPVLFSHYSQREVTGAVLEWQLRCEQLLVDGQVLPAQSLVRYAVNALGEVVFKAPEVSQPTRAKLSLRLMRDNQTIASTEQELLFVPGVHLTLKTGPVYAPDLADVVEAMGLPLTARLSEARLAVVTTLDDACREFILQGGKVLFLAEREDALQAVLPGVQIVPRAGSPWQGDWVSSLGWHRLTDIPTRSVVDFAFAGLTPEHVIRGFAAYEFAQQVYAGLLVGWLHKPTATIARKRLGRGQVLISTFRLQQHLQTNPLATWIFKELLDLIQESEER